MIIRIAIILTGFFLIQGCTSQDRVVRDITKELQTSGDWFLMDLRDAKDPKPIIHKIHLSMEGQVKGRIRTWDAFFNDITISEDECSYGFYWSLPGKLALDFNCITGGGLNFNIRGPSDPISGSGRLHQGHIQHISGLPPHDSSLSLFERTRGLRILAFPPKEPKRFYLMGRTESEILNYAAANDPLINFIYQYESPQLLKMAKAGDNQGIAYALSKGANVNIVSGGRNDSALILATERGCVECVKLLLEHGADANIREIRGESPLFYALLPSRAKAQRPNFQIARMLVSAGADVNATDNAGNFLLARSLTSDAMMSAKFLLENGAKTDIHVVFSFNRRKFQPYPILQFMEERLKSRNNRAFRDIFNLIRRNLENQKISSNLPTDNNLR
ncbi:MAG: ankyrin repeat domain-containing protein [Spirochaetes bacterium]|nr:ankyrin repeat domain-containing protein [Spirochaetota bacterium]